MAKNSQSSIEVYGLPSSGPVQPAESTSLPSRTRIFLIVFLIVVIAGLAYVFSRPAIYATSATLLTVKPKDIDQRSSEADPEHVSIQARLLMSTELLEALGSQLREDGISTNVSPDSLRQILAVRPVPDTNLIELHATGENPDLLQRAVNQWADTYIDYRALKLKEGMARTTGELVAEQTQIQERILQKRAELEQFRQSRDIVSMERGDNRVASKLKGINSALNKAREREAEAAANLQSVRKAIAAGETIIPRDQKAALTAARVDADRMRKRISDLNEKYTPVYIERDPALKALPQQLAELDADIRNRMRIGQQQMLDSTTQEYRAAQSTMQELERQLSEHRAASAQFAADFAEHETLEKSLQLLEEQANTYQQRLTAIEISNQEKYPAMQIVEWALLPSSPVHPDYYRDAALAVGAALIVALFTTWLAEYLGGSRQPSYNGPVTGIQIITPDVVAINHASGEKPEQLTEPSTNRRLPKD